MSTCSRSLKRLAFLIILIGIQTIGGTAFGLDGFLRSSGKKIIDGQGQNVLLRGMGLGGWMLQEGYMLETGDFAGTQHEIKEKIRQLVGTSAMEQFYDAWLANHVTKRDIDSMARWGFNSVRPALHYNLFTLPIEKEPAAGQQTWIDKGFIMLDSLISWCAANKMYVILDLHAAPGGQGRDNNISDRDPAKPSLWESAANRTKTVELWRKLAERYAGNPWVGGYDLINEPNWDFENSGNQNGCNCRLNAPLLDLYKNIITAIRSQDTNHLIFIEGNCWGGNFNGLTSLAAFDSNLAFSFHRYWNQNTTESIQEKLNLRDQFNVPLWMGESGENSNHWFADAISLLEANNIGWSWWPEKKINSIVGPLTVIKTPEYSRLLQYWKYGGTKPDSAYAMNALLQIAENLKLENCIIHYDVLDALFRQPYTLATLPLTGNQQPATGNRIPGPIFAVNFDFGKNGYAYNDIDFQNTGGPGSSDWNRGWIYRNDGPDIGLCSDTAAFTNGYHITDIEAGEWLAYTVQADSSGVYRAVVRTANSSGKGAFSIEIDGRNVSGSIPVPHTGSNQKFIPLTLPDIELSAGKHHLVIRFEEGGFNLNSVILSGPTGAPGLAFSMLSVKTDELGKDLILAFNKPLTKYSPPLADFSLSDGINRYVPVSVTTGPENPPTLRLAFTRGFTDSDRLTLTYTGDQIAGPDNEILPPFTNRPVVNVILPRLTIPGIVEAENYYVNQGFVFEPCQDAGGGKNAGYTNPGDYLEYLVKVAQTGTYRVDYRYSANWATSGGELSLRSEVTQPLHTVSFSSTGGWQNWATASANARLTAGLATIRFTANSDGFNLNRMDITLITDTTGGGPALTAGFVLYPNPANDFVVVDIRNPGKKTEFLDLIDAAGRIIHSQQTPSGRTARCTLNISDYQSGMYYIRVRNNEISGTLPLLIKNLKL
jgi:endoglucanase